MHVTLLALGSHGDVLPYAALGRGLRRAGHDVRLITFEGFRSLAEDRGLAFHSVPGDAAALLATGAGLDLAESGANVFGAYRAAMASFGRLAATYTTALSDPTLAETDVLVNQLPAGLFGADLVEKYGLRHLQAAVIPLTMTRAFPLPGFPAWPARLPGYNRLTYRLLERLMWRGFRVTIDRWRVSTLRLPPTREDAGAALRRQRVPVLNGFSRHVVTRPVDWGSHVHLTGYWFPTAPAWSPPPALTAFLEAGPPPVLVGFGSMPLRDPARAAGIVLEALRRSGRRGLVQGALAAGWGASLPDGILGLDYVPYDWLFPRVQAVVHHGGSGTTAAGLRAGVPTVIVPFLFDQFFWARRVKELGVGPAGIPFKRLAAADLAAAIERAVGDADLSRRAGDLGRAIQAEDGISAAVSLIEALA